MRTYFVVGLLLVSAVGIAAEYAPIPRVLPPAGIEISVGKREAWFLEVNAVRKRLLALEVDAQTAADVEVFLKAVEFASDLGEFYVPKDFDKADELLKVAVSRVTALEAGKKPWTTTKGLTVRGFVSRVDGSVQPYGVFVPDDVDLSKEDPNLPMLVFLHGRGDKQTDLHFIHERLKSKGPVAPSGVVTVHPFGRQCVGFKSAGETDVLEAVHHARASYRTHPARTILMGFSMGGAGAWHLGAHFDKGWIAVLPGAGFAETARYTKTDPESVPWYERKLWGCYDAPCAVRNLFNVQTIAYSGELDKQIQAARVMEEAFAAEGHKLDHRIGPGVEHKYEPKTLEQLISETVPRARNQFIVQELASTNEDDWQGRTLRYNNFPLIRATQNQAAAREPGVLGLEEHWKDARLSTHIGVQEFRTKNVKAFSAVFPPQVASVLIDGTKIKLPERERLFQETFVKGPEGWNVGKFPPDDGLYKIPGLQGPIDDAFLEPFLIVTPGGQSPHTNFAKWAKFEADHFVSRWTGLMRGKPRVKVDRDVTDEDLKQYHVVCWGDPESNSLLARMKEKLPVTFTADEFEMRGKKYARNGHAAVLIYPNPLSPKRYVVLNSGLTFREAHDRTNSQQNPKLPDWAVVDLSEPPSASAPGKIADAGFFDEEWRVKLGSEE